MGSITVTPAARAPGRRSAIPSTAHPIPVRAPIARPRLCAPWSCPVRLRHVEDVAAPEPERTRRLPLDQSLERQRHPLGAAVLLLPEPHHLVAAERRPAAGQR